MAKNQPPTPSAAAAPSQTPSASGASAATATRASAPTAPSPKIPASHQPTPAQQNPNVRKPLAPSLPETPQGTPDPVKAMADRQRAAIDRLVQGEGGAPTPPKATAGAATSSGKTRAATTSGAPQSPPSSPETIGDTTSSAKGQPSTEGASTPSQSIDEATTDESSNASPADSASDAPGKRGPRFEIKVVKKWAEENPEQAAELAKAVFQIDVGEGFIKLQNKARKIKGEIRERQTAAETAAQAKLAAAEEAKTKAEQVAGQLRPMADMWAAAQRKDERGQPVIDFDTADECFRLNMGGVTVDEYMRQRARRGIAHPELARERAARLRVEAELAQLKNTSPARGAQNPNGAAAASAPGAAQGAPEAVKPSAAAPAAPSVDWGDEIPQDHQLRQLTGWEKDLAAEMRRHYDETLDEYSADPEEMADKVLQRRLAALMPSEADPAPAARKRPNTPKRRGAALEVGADGLPDPAALAPRNRQAPSAPRGHRPATADDLDDAGPTDLVQRERWAIERAQKRMRGEL